MCTTYRRGTESERTVKLCAHVDHDGLAGFFILNFLHIHDVVERHLAARRHRYGVLGPIRMIAPIIPRRVDRADKLPLYGQRRI